MSLPLEPQEGAPSCGAGPVGGCYCNRPWGHEGMHKATSSDRGMIEAAWHPEAGRPRVFGGLSYPESAGVTYPEQLEHLEPTLCTRFTYHPPHGDQVERYSTLRREGGAFALLLVGTAPKGRELSIALTKLEEAVFWANAAIARGEASRHPDHEEPDPTG